MDELVGLFLSESRARLERLTEVIGLGDLAESAKLFHKLQGSAASVEALRLRQLCALGEEACLNGDLEKARRVFDLSRTELDRILSRFDTWKKP